MAKPQIKVMLALLVAEVLAMIEITMIYSAMRYLVQEFGSPEAIGWTITGFLLASAVSAALFGRLGDIYDRKRLLLIVIALSVVGSLIAGSSSVLAGVVVGRTIQGFAGAIFPLCIGILRENIEPRALPMYIGVLSAVMTVSAGMGMLLGGVIVDHLSWHWIFYVTALIGVLAWLAVYFVVPSTKLREPEPGINFLGGILFAPAVVCLILAVTRVQEWGWTNPYTLTTFFVGMILLLAWGRSELRAKIPLLNIRLLLEREILFANVATVLFALSWMQFGQTWSLLLQQPSETGAGLGFSASLAGLIMQPQTLMALVGGPLAGWCMVRYGVRFSIATGALVLGSAWVAAILKHDTIAFIVLLMVVMGLSSSFLVSLMVSSVARAAPAHRTSEAIGILTLIRTIANSVGAIVVFYLLGSSTVTGPDGRAQFPDALAYNTTMTYIAAVTFLIALLYIFFYRHKPSPDANSTASPTASPVADAGQPGKAPL